MKTKRTLAIALSVLGKVASAVFSKKNRKLLSKISPATAASLLAGAKRLIKPGLKLALVRAIINLVKRELANKGKYEQVLQGVLVMAENRWKHARLAR
jgi:hypothetical protein